MRADPKPEGANTPDAAASRTPTSRTPTAAEIRGERERVDWSPAAAAAAACVTPRVWGYWEAGSRSMSPGLWLLFRLLTGAAGIQYATPSDGHAVLKLRVTPAPTCEPRSPRSPTWLI
jgi:hypothetical protein